MSKLKFQVSTSIDGFMAGPNQRLELPFGDGDPERVHRWMFEQREENAAEIEAQVDAGAFIMGRNMFSPGRGEWDLDWRGYWGDEPPYHAPVFVLTHYPREPLRMSGGTTYNFVTDGIDSALTQAKAAAGDKDVMIAGGAATINEYLAAALVDEFTVNLAPITLGAGERLFDGVGDLTLEPLGVHATELATHVRYRVVH